MKQNVYMRDWMVFQPYEKPSSTDFYYLRIAQQVFKLLSQKMVGPAIEPLSPKEKKNLACFLTAWFEDVVSETGIWTAFIQRHKEQYGKYLPFYEMGEDYYPGEINREDLYFLLWYFYSWLVRDYSLVYPLETELLSLGDRLFDLFDRYYETAPENQQLIDFLHIPETETVFYMVRIKMEWLLFHSYLFHFHLEELNNELLEAAEENMENEFLNDNIEQLQYEIIDRKTLGQVTALLARKGNEWLAEILGKKHPLYEPLMQLSERNYGTFIFRGFDEKNIHLEHIPSGEIMEVTRKSLQLHPDMKEGQSIMGISLVKWMGEWWFTGIYSLWDYDERMVESERNKLQEKRRFHGEEDRKIKLEVIAKQEEAFLEYNNGLPYRFFPNGNDVEEFINGFLRFYREKIIKEGEKNLSPEEKERLRKNKEQYSDKPKVMKERFDEDTDSMVFFNSGHGMETLFGYNILFDETLNGKAYLSENDFLILTEQLLLEKDASPGLIRYFAESGKLPFLRFPGEKPDEKLLRNHLEFVLGFYLPEAYREGPRIGII